MKSPQASVPTIAVADLRERVECGAARAVGALQAVARQLAVLRGRVGQVEPERGLDVRVEAEAAVGELEVGGLLRLLTPAAFLPAEAPREQRVFGRRPAELGHDDRPVRVAVARRAHLDLAEAEEAEAPIAAVGLAVVAGRAG